MTSIIKIVQQTLMITGFVFAMMLAIEYLNVLSKGQWDKKIADSRWGQTLFSALLGTTPGCLGAYAVTSLYMHRVVTLGSLVAAMTATCGDETFVMLALFPRETFIILGILLIMGIAAGVLVDLILKQRKTRLNVHLKDYKATHDHEAECVSFHPKELAKQWKQCTPHRGWLTAFLVIFLLGVVSGQMGHEHLGVDSDKQQPAHTTAYQDEHTEHSDRHEHAQEWNWVRLTLLIAGLIGLFVVVTVPDHFLEKHLWEHIARVHIWRILLWTFGALLTVQLLLRYVDIKGLVETHRLPVLVMAALMGFLPISGPHLIFVTLFAHHDLPFSVLLANCIAQSGHGTLPLLAHSRRAFLAVKVMNVSLGLATGVLGHLMGW